MNITLQEVISRADALKPNAFNDETKVEWINKLEGIIQTDIVGEKNIVYKWGDDCNKELLVQRPYSDIYENYVMAMIDYYNNDINSYQNSMANFNSVWEEFAKAYRRKNITDLGYIKNYW